MDARMDRNTIVRYLDWYESAGVDEAIGDHPVSRYRTEAPASSETRVPGAPRAIGSIDGRKPMAAPMSQQATEQSARDAAAAASTLQDLRKTFAAFDGCGLKETATNFVFSDGNPEAALMLVGEAPGAEEDRAGLPFVGPAGRLLDKMLAAIGIDRTGAYITNIVPWRPPGNRTPTPSEIASCLPFLYRHIELAGPRLLCTLGAPATLTLLNPPPNTGITRLRGQWREFILPTGDTIPALPVFHPAYLLRQPAQKRMAWRDFLEIRQRLDQMSE